MVTISRRKIPTGTETLAVVFKRIVYANRLYNLVKVFNDYELDKPEFRKYYTNTEGKYWSFFVGENKRTAKKIAVYKLVKK
jgi:hypothetical protein